ncbi:hypothetical protein H6G89_08420 [Oscillatoria sp. FACHB-1407]|uniref:hypothetical protein n=1 Tax=Oscillatoria sp. FACHB-1407 TaxID=2692847 RepID=UPI0016859866|nr:hypothetical protein [Oscillatoria sp. FACHB-1407]MBD2461064.1 hypothetical protein [Oscillatoria sp. FACHB-1407]
MVNGQWSVVNGQWSMVNGQWSMVNDQWLMVSGQWLDELMHRAVIFGQLLLSKSQNIFVECYVLVSVGYMLW